MPIRAGKTTELIEAPRDSDFSYGRVLARIEQIAASLGQSRIADPAERGRPEKAPEVRFQCAWPDAGDFGQDVQAHLGAGMATQPLERANQVAGQRGAFAIRCEPAC